LRHPDRVRASRQAQRARHPDYFVLRQDERRSAISTLKLEAGCIDCSYSEKPEALQFDHLPGFEKRQNVGSMMMHSLDTILDEIEKCVVRCANCHAVKTNERRVVAA